MRSKKNIVLLHGWGATTKKLEPLKDELEKLNWNVYIPELPGFEGPAPKEVWGVLQYSDYVKKEIIKTLGTTKKYVVFGHSFGGRIAVKMCSFGDNYLTGIVLCDASGISRPPVLKRYAFYLMAKVGKVFLTIPVFGAIWQKLLYKAAREHDYEKAQGVMKEVFKKVVSEDLKPDVSKVKIPTLVLWGKSDKTTPVKDARFLKRNIKKSQIVLYADEGHRLPYEKPRELAREINKWHRTL